MRRTFFKGKIIAVAVVTSVFFKSGFSQTSKSSFKKPNIVLILVDDLGYGDLSCYGQTMFSTPNIDKLADNGVKFNFNYAGAPVCAPSRASLLTGKHTGHSSVRGNQPFPQLLGENEPTIASVLKAAGYTTGIVGKWGIGHPPPVTDPNQRGFDYAYGFVNMWHAHNFFAEFLYENGNKVALPGNKLKAKPEFDSWVGDKGDEPEGYGEALIKETYVPDKLTEKALKFIADNKKNPFFLMYTTTLPHGNNEMKSNGSEVPAIKVRDGVYKSDYGRFANKNWPDAEKGFAEMINQLDLAVGKIVEQLKAQGLEKNTLLIFTSDNGPHAEAGHDDKFFKSSGVLRGKKRDLYEGGIREPFLAVWPEKIKPGSVSNEVVAFWDYLPTFAEIGGANIPSKIDGISFVPALTGKEQKKKHKYLYWEFYESGGRQAVLQYPWKAVKLNTQTFKNDGVFELYNIEEDPSELTNIALKHPSIVKRMESYMKKAHVPKPNMSLFVPKDEFKGKF